MNNQQVTKIINYFRINHQFHSPYTFILDGNFLAQLVEKSLSLEDKLKPILPGKYRLKVTSCTLQELQMLGEQFKLVHDYAAKFQIIKCSHTFQAVDRCILDNSPKEQSLTVCTQDKVLRRKLRPRSIGLMYFGPDQRITMEDIEYHSLRNAKQQEKEKFMPAEQEREQLDEHRQRQQTLQKLKKKKEQFKIASQQGIELKYLKKKVLKGPNPLSAKLKKKKNFKAEATPEDAVPQKKKRIRKRKNKNKVQVGEQ